ncbi:MAG TPA: PAS domain S-box protein [Anaerolineae bacterium]|nr:PAS domain S-box protein [Anaerolineae bacterium]
MDALIENLPVGVVILADNQLLTANAEFSRIVEYSKKEVLSFSFSKLVQNTIHPKDRTKLQALLKSKDDNTSDYPYTKLRILLKDGSTRWVEVTLAHLYYEGQPATQATFIDITESKQTELFLKESKARLDGIIETATDAIITIDESHHIVLFNAAAERIFQYTAVEVIGQPLNILLPSRFHQSHTQLIDEYKQSNQTLSPMEATHDARGRRANGEEFPIEAMLSQVEISGQKLFTIILRDITKRKQTEAEKERLFEALKQHKTQFSRQTMQLRHLSRQIVLAQEEERRRISRELHDESGQDLTVLKLNLEMMWATLTQQPQLSDLQYRSFLQQIENASHLCGKTMQQLRTLAHDLRPSALDDLGLDLTLEGLCQDFVENTPLNIIYNSEEIPRLSPTAEISLYRFLQETLTNIVKHAQAHKVRVSLESNLHEVSLLVKDDGVGFDKESIRFSHNHLEGIGLLGMQERLNLLGGILEIITHPDQGTCLVARIPITPESELLSPLGQKEFAI